MKTGEIMEKEVARIEREAIDFGRLDAWLNERGVTEIECLVPDLTGVPRGKILPRAKFRDERGMRLPEGVLGMTVTGEVPDSEVLNRIIATTDRDLVLRPDPNTVRIVPWATDPTAEVIHDCFTFDGQLVGHAPRTVLRNVLSLYNEQGWRPVVAPELEFYILARNTDPNQPLQPPIGRSGRSESGRQAYSIDAVNEFDPLFEDIYDYCEKQELDIDTLIHEIGTGQMEINFLHGDPLELADSVFLFKRTVRETALRHNMYATFMAKPLADEPGSAMHIHQSVLNCDGKNIFSQENGEPSEHFRWALGGLQKYLPACMPLLAPYVNSYRRLVKNSAAPTNVRWGRDNRTVGIRVPHCSPAARRFENRVVGADANPYIAMAATLACCYLGMVNQIEPSEEQTGNAYENAHELPRDLNESIDLMRNCKPIHSILSENFINLYATVKEAEYAEFMRVISPWERQFLLLHV